MTSILEPRTNINSYQKSKILHKLALEMPQRTIAKQHNITQPAVSDIKRANEDKIKKVQQELIAANIENIQSSITDDIENNANLAVEFKNSKSITSEKVAYKSSVQKNIIKPLLEKIGIYPSNTMSVHIGDNIDNSSVMSQSFQQFIDFQSNKPLNNGDVIDIDGVNGENSSDNEQ